MIKFGERINDGDVQLAAFAKGKLKERHALRLRIPPVNGLDIERESMSRADTGDQGGQPWLVADELNAIVEHTRL